MNLSVTIMAHPARAGLVDELQGRLDRPAHVEWDRKSSEWDTGRRAWLSYDRSCSHHLVLQDDAIVCGDLVQGLEAGLAHVPEWAAVSVYFGDVRPYVSHMARAAEAAASDEIGWLVFAALYWGVALILPTAVIEDTIREQDRVRILEYDRRISRWLTRHKMPVWYTWPSLVDHHQGPSMLGGREDRHAFRFVGADVSALDVDWSKPPAYVRDPRREGRMQFPTRVSRKPVVARRVPPVE